jgi:hypothetical protein
MTGSLRRRIAGILALALGLGVVMSSAPATSAPARATTTVTTTAPVSAVHAPGYVVTDHDWWW